LPGAAAAAAEWLLSLVLEDIAFVGA